VMQLFDVRRNPSFPASQKLLQNLYAGSRRSY
jgi:hypothetical protein